MLGETPLPTAFHSSEVTRTCGGGEGAGAFTEARTKAAFHL